MESGLAQLKHLQANMLRKQDIENRLHAKRMKVIAEGSKQKGSNRPTDFIFPILHPDEREVEAGV